jgi:RNA-directed DNA polymerase
VSVPGSLLPVPYLDRTVSERQADFIRLLSSRATDEIVGALPETLLAKKPRGLRPVLVLPLGARVIYRAIVDDVAKQLPALDRSTEAYTNFWNGPLTDRRVVSVGLADVSACYQYIDHVLLEKELVRQTGEADLNGTLIGLIGDMVGRAFGLPQNQHPSHVLADVVLGLVERRLIRRGHKVWRYSDDFRVGGRNRAEVVHGLEDLERELNGVGLTLNDEKTSVRNRKSYQDLFRRSQQRLAEVRKLVAEDLADWNPYTDEITMPKKEDVTLVAALKVVADWIDDLNSGKTHYGYEAISERQLLTSALSSFQVLESDEGLQYCNLMLVEEPSLTPRISAYLGNRCTSSQAARDTVDEIVSGTDSELSEWQCLWLIDSITGLKLLSADQVKWARSLMTADPSRLVAARAAVALAGHDEASEQEIASVLSSQRAAGQADAVYALAIRVLPSKSSPMLDAVIRDAPEWSWVVKAAQSVG